ncbi:MAG: CvpA family protein [Clostridia bacterium]|nr:CvpA family protein [Clostridia bacterium]
MLSIVLDIAVLVIFWLFVMRGIKKGLVKSVLELFKGIASFVAAFMFYKPVSEYIFEFDFAKNILENFRNGITENVAVSVQEADIFPKWAESFITEGSMNAGVLVADKLTELVSNVASIVIIYVTVRILFMIFNFLFDKVKIFKIGELNAFGGACFGFINALILIYVAMLVLFLFSTSDGGAINTAMDSTYIARLFYHNNLILNLFF